MRASNPKGNSQLVGLIEILFLILGFLAMVYAVRNGLQTIEGVPFVIGLFIFIVGTAMFLYGRSVMTNGSSSM